MKEMNEINKFNNQSIENEVLSLEKRVKSGENVSLEEIQELDNHIRTFNFKEAPFERLVKTRMENIKAKVLKKTNPSVTKWDIFKEEIESRDGLEDLKALLEIIDQKRFEDTITKEELDIINSMYDSIRMSNALNLLSPFDKAKAQTEIDKKIRLFRKKLNRVIDQDFGSWIKQLRKEKGYSLKDLENVSGVTASYIHRIETGARKSPSVPIAESLAKALGVNPDEFFKKLNLLSESNSNEEATYSLTDLLSLNNFTINGKLVTREQKNALLNLVNNVITADWDNKLEEGMKLIQDIDKVKIALEENE